MERGTTRERIHPHPHLAPQSSPRFPPPTHPAPTFQQAGSQPFRTMFFFDSSILSTPPSFLPSLTPKSHPGRKGEGRLEDKYLEKMWESKPIRLSKPAHISTASFLLGPNNVPFCRRVLRTVPPSSLSFLSFLGGGGAFFRFQIRNTVFVRSLIPFVIRRRGWRSGWGWFWEWEDEKGIYMDFIKVSKIVNTLETRPISLPPPLLLSRSDVYFSFRVYEPKGLAKSHAFSRNIISG